jgi:hypothetical protein
MPAKTPEAKWLDLLIKKAPALREAGILTVSLGDCAATFAPVAAKPEAWIPEAPKEESNMAKFMDALDDPDTFDGESTHGFYDSRRQGPASNDGMRVLDD